MLVGDHHQLPPTVLSRDAELAGLNVSLFDRLSMGGVTPFLLDTQYRMHPTLALFSSVTFYEVSYRSRSGGHDGAHRLKAVKKELPITRPKCE